MKNTSLKSGISIIEILIAMAILAIIISVAIPNFSKMRENQVFKNTISDVVSTINTAKSNTLASLDSSQYGVYLASNQVVIFKGDTYVGGSPDNKIIEIMSPASISNVTLLGQSGTSGEFYFKRLTGEPSKSGTILISMGGETRIVTISPSGSISVD